MLAGLICRLHFCKQKWKKMAILEKTQNLIIQTHCSLEFNVLARSLLELLSKAFNQSSYTMEKLNLSHAQNFYLSVSVLCC